MAIGQQRISRRGFVKSVGIATGALASVGLFGAARPALAAPLRQGSKPYDGVNLVWGLPSGGIPDKTLAEVLPMFREETGITVTVQSAPYKDYHDKLVLDLGTRTGSIDLITLNNMWRGEFIEPGHIAPIDDLLTDSRFPDPKIDTFHPVLMDSYGRYKGKTYGFPLVEGTMIFMYNQEMFEKAGLDPNTPPATWDQVYEFGQKLTSGEQYGFALMAGPGIQSMCTYSALLYARGGRFLDEQNRPLFTSPESEAALTFIVEKLKPIAPPASTTWDFPESATAMQQGTTAMVLQWDGAAAIINDPAASKVAGKIAYAPAPDGKTPLGGWGIVSSAYSKNREAAYTFMNWITSEPIAEKMASTALVPGRLSVMTGERAQQEWPWIVVSAKALDGAIPWPPIPPIEDIFTHISKAVNSAAVGAMPPAAALQELNTTVEDLLRSRGMLA